MNYQAVYDRLMQRSVGRMIDGYTERHHILPRCLDGGDEEANIAVLTAEEHYLAHQLLVRIHPFHLGILSAAHIMTATWNPGRRGNKLYGWLRRRMSVAQTGQKRPASVGQKIGNRLRGRKRDPAAVAKGADKMRGRTISPEHCAKLSAAQIGKKRTPQEVAKNSAGHRGLKQSPETVAKRLASVAARYAVTPKPKHTMEARAKMRASRLAYIAVNGPTFGPEIEARRITALKGVPRPPEVIAKVVATKAAKKAARIAQSSLFEGATA